MLRTRLQRYMRSNDRSVARRVSFRLLSTSTSNLQVMIFGSSTDVGKTVVAAGICRAALSRSRKVCYIKPVQTGELDEYFVSLYTNPQGICDMFLRTLHHWSSSISPHLASRINANEGPISDADLVASLKREIRAFSNTDEDLLGKERFTVVETAGGVLSPGPSKTLQADIYRSLRLPIILVGDSKLGGITTTLSAYESLRLRGYTVHAIVMIEHPGSNKFGNVLMIREHLERSLSSSSPFLSADNGDYGSTPKWAVNKVPKVFRMFPLPSEKLLHHWFIENSDQFGALFDHIAAAVEEETRRLMAMRRDGQETVWWPFTQHASIGDGDVTFIESAHGDQFRVVTPEPQPSQTVAESNAMLAAMSSFSDADSVDSSISMQPVSLKGTTKVNVTDLFDGCGSWWTQGVGHGNPSMSLALAEAAGRYGHVMFPSNLHPPAVQLAQYLLEKGPGRGWANRVFYSDDGSTGMEVAIKMAMRLWDIRTKKGLIKSHKTLPQDALEEDLVEKHMKNVVVLTQKDCYHGDTLGTMDTAEAGPFNESQHPWYRPRTVALPLPLVAYRNGKLSIDAAEMAPSCNIGCTTENCTCTPMSAAASASGPWGSIENLMNVEARMGSDLEKAYRVFVKTYLEDCDLKGLQLGALLMEPLMLGAGGLKFIDPLYQKVLVQECRARCIPIVYDEVAVGMYRLGPSTTSSILHEYPDIAVYGKMLSGGYMPLAATLATTETFDAFLGKKKWHALLHGHSFTANPIACAAALESARLLEGSHTTAELEEGEEMNQNFWFDPEAFGGKGGVRTSFLESDVREVSTLPGVKGVMSMGSVLSVELKANSPPPGGSYQSHGGGDILGSHSAASHSAPNKNSRYYNSNASAVVVSLLKQNNVYARPLGNVVYLMPTPMTPEVDKQRLIRVIKRCITKAFYLRQPQGGGSHHLDHLDDSFDDTTIV